MSNGFVIPFDNKLKCSICQDRLKDARSLPCGHTYCKECITRSVRASYEQGIKCSECKKTTKLPAGGVNDVPRCFTLNFLLDEIQQTFGSSGQKVDIPAHGFQAKEMFACAICLEPLRDARYLPCGHCFCKPCIAKQNSSGNIKCCKCQKTHNLPSGGTDRLPVAYRINSITAELNEEEETAGTSGGSSGTASGRPQTTERRSSGRLVDDVAREKKLAQAKARRSFQVFVQKPNGRGTVTIDTCSQDTIGELKRKIQATPQINLAPDQQFLTCAGKPLDQDAKTLQQCNIREHSTITISSRLKGGCALERTCEHIL